MAVIDCGGKRLDLSRPRVMGILNVTPDSFSDGGNFLPVGKALAHARQMVAEGAAIIDVGGESTRPGAGAVGEAEELQRVIPIVEALAADLPVPVSIDTCKPGVMRAAVEAGAGLINDVLALQVPGALEVARDCNVPVCLMHMQGEPRTMQQNPTYQDVMAEVRDFLKQRAEVCMAAGISPQRLLLDPGFGFGKTLTHNLALLKNLVVLTDLGYPVLVGISRKTMIGAILNRRVDERLYGSLAAAVMAVTQGARIIRAHDVRPTVEVLKVATAVMTTE